MKGDNRDYADLSNPEIAVYNFRGYTVILFEKKTGMLLFGQNANNCCFVTEDFLLISKFLENCYKFKKGEITTIESVCVD